MASLRRMTVVIGLLLCMGFMPNSPASPEGVGQEGNQGCQCHAEDTGLNIAILGLPEVYEANTTYVLTLTLASGIEPASNASQGGFRMVVTNGTLSFDAEEAQPLDGGWTHRAAGTEQREWTFAWTSPSDNNSRTEFRVWGNAVNGNQAPTGDGWAASTWVVAGASFTGDLDVGRGIDGLSVQERVFLGVALLTIAGLLWTSLRP